MPNRTRPTRLNSAASEVNLPNNPSGQPPPYDFFAPHSPPLPGRSFSVPQIAPNGGLFQQSTPLDDPRTSPMLGDRLHRRAPVTTEPEDDQPLQIEIRRRKNRGFSQSSDSRHEQERPLQTIRPPRAVEMTAQKQNPRSKLLTIVFIIIQSLSIIPSFVGFGYSVYRLCNPMSRPLFLASSSWIDPTHSISRVVIGKSTRLDWFFSALWALACAYYTYSLAKGLLRRWLVYYSTGPAIIRALSLQAICWPLTLTTHTVLSFDQPIAAWMVCATTAAISNVVQIWVTSNIVEKTDTRGNRVLSVVVSSIIGPAVGSDQLRKRDRVLSWKRVLWGTLLPLAMLCWATMMGLLWQQFQVRYHGGDGVRVSPNFVHSPESIQVAAPTDLNANATMRIVVLVSSSWSETSLSNRAHFRQTSARLLPVTTDDISVIYRFMLGNPPSPHVAARLGTSIDQEVAEYGDIVLLSSLDSPDELSRKALESWKWAAEFDSDYVIKTYDDVFLRMDVISNELYSLGKVSEYWKGFRFWNIRAELSGNEYHFSRYPPYTSGILHILSHDLVQYIAFAVASRFFVANEDQNLGIWLLPTGIQPIHDHRIQSFVCENDVIAKGFHSKINEELSPLDLYTNIINGRPLCDGYQRRLCGICYPSCRGKDSHWKEENYACDPIKGATKIEKAISVAPVVPRVKESPVVVGNQKDTWIIPGLLSKQTSIFSDTNEWSLLHFMVWTLPSIDFSARHFSALESILVHEPRAVVIILSTTLNSTMFERYLDSGYAIHVVFLPDEQAIIDRGLYLGQTSKQWLLSITKWKSYPHFGTHLSLFLRFVFLFKYGGTYVDFDAPWVRKPSDAQLEFIGSHHALIVSDLSWTLEDDGLYIYPGVAMRFKRGWLIFKNIVERSFSNTYDPTCCDCVGSRAITLAVKADRALLEANGFTILPPTTFFPKHRSDAQDLIHSLAPGRALEELQKISQTSWTVCLFGKFTSALPIQPGSIVDQIFHSFSLIPTETSSLELIAPTHYTFKRRSKSLDSMYHKTTDGKFEGMDVIYVKSSTGRAPWASISVEVEKGRVEHLTSTVRFKSFSQEGSPASASKVAFEIKDASIKEVNAVLRTLAYSPGKGSDKMKITVVFGEEKATREIDIENTQETWGTERIAY